MRSQGHRQGRGGLRRGLCPPRYPTIDLAAVTDEDNKVSDTKGYMKLWFKHDKRTVTSLHPSISPRSLCRKAWCCETREREAHGPSLKCEVRLSPLLFPLYLPVLASCCENTARLNVALSSTVSRQCCCAERIQMSRQEPCACRSQCWAAHSHANPMSASESTTVYLMPSPLSLFPGRRDRTTLSTCDVTSYSVKKWRSVVSGKKKKLAYRGYLFMMMVLSF